VGKVWNWSNFVLIKVVDFFTRFDKKFVWTKYFFHRYGFLTLEHALLTGLGSREHSPASRGHFRLKNHRYERNILFRQSFYQILSKNNNFYYYQVVSIPYLTHPNVQSVRFSEHLWNIANKWFLRLPSRLAVKKKIWIISMWYISN